MSPRPRTSSTTRTCGAPVIAAGDADHPRRVAQPLALTRSGPGGWPRAAARSAESMSMQFAHGRRRSPPRLRAACWRWRLVRGLSRRGLPARRPVDLSPVRTTCRATARIDWIAQPPRVAVRPEALRLRGARAAVDRAAARTTAGRGGGRRDHPRRGRRAPRCSSTSWRRHGAASLFVRLSRRSPAASWPSGHSTAVDVAGARDGARGAGSLAPGRGGARRLAGHRGGLLGRGHRLALPERRARRIPRRRGLDARRRGRAAGRRAPVAVEPGERQSDLDPGRARRSRRGARRRGRCWA